jgi:hypothetical protein
MSSGLGPSAAADADAAGADEAEAAGAGTLAAVVGTDAEGVGVLEALEDADGLSHAAPTIPMAAAKASRVKKILEDVMARIVRPAACQGTQFVDELSRRIQ